MSVHSVSQPPLPPMPPLEDTGRADAAMSRATANANAAVGMLKTAITSLSNAIVNIKGDSGGVPSIDPIHIGNYPTPPSFPAYSIPPFPDPPAFPEGFVQVSWQGQPPTPPRQYPLPPVSLPEEVLSGNEVQEYISLLLNAVKDELEARIINQDTGLPMVVETAIFNRDEIRSAQALRDALQRARYEWSNWRGPIPEDVFLANQEDLETEYANLRSAASRGILVKKAELAQDGMKKALTLAVALESHLAHYYNQFMETLLKLMVAMQEAKNDIYKLWTSFLNMYYEAVKDRNEAKSAEVKAKTALNDLLLAKYEAELERYKLIALNLVNKLIVTLKTYEADMAVYQGKIEQYVAQSELAVKTINSKLSAALSDAETSVAAAEDTGQASIALAKIASRAAIASGHCAAQVAAGALAGIRVGWSKHINQSVGASSNLHHNTVVEHG